jgi:hypothetical protein
VTEFDRCAPWIEAALGKFPEHTLDDVRGMVAAGEARLWAFERSCVVTQPLFYPRSKALFWWLMGGDLNELLEHEPEIGRWARSEGFSRMFGGLVYRFGWERALRRSGWKPTHMIFERAL